MFVLFLYETLPPHLTVSFPLYSQHKKMSSPSFLVHLVIKSHQWIDLKRALEGKMSFPSADTTMYQLCGEVGGRLIPSATSWTAQCMWEYHVLGLTFISRKTLAWIAIYCSGIKIQILGYNINYKFKVFAINPLCILKSHIGAKLFFCIKLKDWKEKNYSLTKIYASSYIDTD